MTNAIYTRAFLTKQHALMLLTILLLSTFTQPLLANEATDKTVQTFFTQLSQKNPDEAAKTLVGTRDVGRFEDLTDQLKKLKSSLTGLSTKVGPYAGNEQIAEKAIGSRFVHVQYLAYFEREPVHFIFSFYRYKKEWQVFDFSFNYKFSEQVKNLANQQLITTQTNK